MADKILSFRVDVQGVSKEAQELTKLETALSKLNEERKESQRLLKKGEITRKQHESTLARLKSKTTDLKVERSRLTAVERQASKEYKSSTGSINQLRIRMSRLREEMRSLNLATTAGKTKFKQLNAELQKGTTKLRGFDRQMSGSKTLVGEYGRGITSAFKGLAASFIGITALFRVLRNLVKVTGDFDSATAKLASITGKTRDEIAELTEEAKKLGAVSQFTASQVTDLQVSLAKLGFTVEDISNATPAIIDFATAVGAELGSAAKVAGVAVRAFGLSTLETGDAVAALAVGTTKSALAFEDYETILSTLGPVAKAYGFTLEDTIALTGTLRDAGFDASKAATATRNILLKLADANGVLAKKLGGAATTLPELVKQLASLDEKGISLAETLEVTDLRSVAAFSQLLRGADSVGKLREEVTDVNEKLSEMVKIRLDSYAGDVKALSSAWEGFILSLKTSGVLREVVQLLKDAILQVSNLSLAFTKFHKQTDEQLSRSFDLLGALSNKQGQHFDEMIEFLNELGDEGLLTRGVEQIGKDFAMIRNVNQKEGLALAQEFLRRRQVDAEKEIEIETAKRERIAADEIAQEKKREADKRKITTGADEKVAKERAKQQEELNKALERTVVLLANIKDVGKLENTIFDIVTGEFSIENIEEQIANLEFVFTDLDQSIIESSDATTQALIDNAIKRFENEDRLALQTAKLQKQIEEEKINISIGGANEIFNVGSSLLDRKQVKLDQQLKDELISEEKFAEEKAKLRRKQAAIDKIQALFNIALNTAIGASNAASKIITLPLVPFIIGLGAIQAAAVLAEPLPAFPFGGKVQKSDGKGGRIKPGNEMPWSTPQGDNTLVLAKPGELYLNKSQQNAIGGADAFKRIGVPGFAAGGRVGISSPLPGTGIPDMNKIAALITNGINNIQVIQNVNELNEAQGELAVINSTNEL